MSAMHYAKKANQMDLKVHNLLFINRMKESKSHCFFAIKDEEEEEEEIFKLNINFNKHIQKSLESSVRNIIKERRMAQMLYLLSPAAFRCVRCYINIVSESTIKRDLNPNINVRITQLLDINSVSDIAIEWRKQNKLVSKTHIPCVLSVDAVTFDPSVQLDKDGKLIGID